MQIHTNSGDRQMYIASCKISDLIVTLLSGVEHVPVVLY